MGAPLSTTLISAASLEVSGNVVSKGVPIATLGVVLDMTGCTTAQLADPSVTKSPTPVFAPDACWDNHRLYFRTQPTQAQWIQAGIHSVNAHHASARRMAGLFLDDPQGRQTAELAPSAFTTLGDGRTFTGSSMFTTTTDFTAALQTLVASDPEVIIYSGRLAQFIAMLESYVALRGGMVSGFTPPPNFGNIAFVGTMLGSSPGAWMTASAEARQVAANQALAIYPTWDTTSPGYQHWRDAYLAYNPNGMVAGASQGRLYDTTTVLALATVAAGSVVGTDIAAQIEAVSIAVSRRRALTAKPPQNEVRDSRLIASAEE